MQTKTYISKVAELQALIEEKAKEKNKLEIQVDDLTQSKARVLQRVEDLQELELGKHHVLVALEELILKKGEQLQALPKPYEKRIETLSKALSELNRVITEASKRRNSLQEEKDREVRLLKQNDNLKKLVLDEIAELKRIQSEADNADEELEAKLLLVEQAKQRVVDFDGKIVKDREGFNLKVIDFKLYVKRLKKLYLANGKAFQDSWFDNINPIKYFPSKKLLDKLKKDGEKMA